MTRTGKVDTKAEKAQLYTITVVYRDHNRVIYSRPVLPSLCHLVSLTEAKFCRVLAPDHEVAGFYRRDEKMGQWRTDIVDNNMLHTMLKQTPSLTLHAKILLTGLAHLLGETLKAKREQDAWTLIAAGVNPWRRCMGAWRNPTLYGAQAVHFAAAAGLPDFVRRMIETLVAKLSMSDYNQKTLAQYCDDGQLYLNAPFMDWLAKWTAEKGLARIVGQTREKQGLGGGEEAFLQKTEIGRRLLCMVRGLRGGTFSKVGDRVLILKTQTFGTVSDCVMSGGENKYLIQPSSVWLSANEIVPFPFPTAADTLAPYSHCNESNIFVGSIIGGLLIVLAIAVVMFFLTIHVAQKPQQHHCFLMAEQCVNRVLDLSPTKLLPIQWQIEHVSHKYYNEGYHPGASLQIKRWNFEELNVQDCQAAAAWAHRSCQNPLHEIVMSTWFENTMPPIVTLVPKHSKRHPSAQDIQQSIAGVTERDANWLAHTLNHHAELPDLLRSEPWAEQLWRIKVDNFTFPESYIKTHPNEDAEVEVDIQIKVVSSNGDLERNFIVLVDSDLNDGFTVKTMNDRDSLNECATLCLADRSCTAVSFDAVSRLCMLKNHHANHKLKLHYKARSSLAFRKSSHFPSFLL